MNYMDKYDFWKASDSFDEATKEELRSIEGNNNEIKDRFYKDLEFGTGGLRGIIGAGTNRMNKYTVGKATQGLANYIIKNNPEGKSMGVAIAYDSRNMSPEFAEMSALVLNANGIKAYVFDELRPTPELSFAVRYLGCTAGIVVTASHNPPEYNGYKVYWADGAQVVYPKDEGIIGEVNAINDFSLINTMDKETAVKEGLFNVIGKKVDDAFVENIKKQTIRPEEIKKAEDMIIVYTPLHGSGNKPVRRVLNEVGFKNVFVVPEQEMPDGTFRTVGYPNPEDPKAFTLAVNLAKEKNADIIIGTDPDADRIGVVIKNNSGEYKILTGNMTGALLTEYVLGGRKEKGMLPENSAVIKTIVTTEMVRTVAENYNAKLFEVLTGFKFIGEKIKQFEEDNTYSYVFGFEESYGCLSGTYARDKDAVGASMLVCEMAAYYKNRGMTLFDGLMELYEKYGFYKEGVKSLTLKGVDGAEQIQKVMEYLRKNTPVEFAGNDVIWSKDYKTKEFVNVKTGEKETSMLPISNVLYYELAGKAWLCVRPSGTEPKIKFYMGVKAESLAQADEKIDALEKSVDELLTKII
ncbi:MAG: phospho-sugar mutase [Candidatus Metalachnospira sp.]|nr:phospho-sugar mutase [Candidatus Metalachnospira sp.]